MSIKTVETDIVIIGGGIAGLWLLNRLRQEGFSTLLLESATLGGGQTHQAQGIIHGGMKYALQGKLTSAAEAISNMPALWNDCLSGHGAIDLSHVTVLSPNHYLWTTSDVTSKLAGFIAGMAFKKSLNALKREDYPALFKHPQFQGQVYALDEIVLDMHTLLRELAKNQQDVIFKIDPMEPHHLQWDETGKLSSLIINASPLHPLPIKAQKYIFTAGAGNELLLNQLKQPSIKMQRRPLHMVAVRHDYSDPIYAHCLGLRAVPRLTITTHKAQDGKSVWYLGGQLAEEGVERPSEQQIQTAKNELIALFPWLDFSKATFHSFFIDRAEHAEAQGKRPDSFFAKEIENCIVAWPTKLAFAPLLATNVLQLLKQAGITPQFSNLHELRAWPMPSLGIPLWDAVPC